MILVRHAPRVAYSLRLALFYSYIYFPQTSRIPDDPGVPRVAYTLHLTLFYIYFPQSSRIPDDPGAPCVPLRHHLLPSLRPVCRRLLDLFPRPP
jgi:hypothetical protein